MHPLPKLPSSLPISQNRISPISFCQQTTHGHVFTNAIIFEHIHFRNAGGEFFLSRDCLLPYRLHLPHPVYLVRDPHAPRRSLPRHIPRAVLRHRQYYDLGWQGSL